MRKRLIARLQELNSGPDHGWLNVEALAEVEITSEDSMHPIESALLGGRGSGWRASEPGQQTIRLLFTRPQRLSRIRLVFEDCVAQRAQEFLLRWSPDRGQSFREIVRQQWNFHPQGSPVETEEYNVELSGVTILELNIIPEISGREVKASLAQMRIS